MANAETVAFIGAGVARALDSAKGGPGAAWPSTWDGFSERGAMVAALLWADSLDAMRVAYWAPVAACEPQTWAYEVCEPFGAWVAGCMIEGREPVPADAVAEARRLVEQAGT